MTWGKSLTSRCFYRGAGIWPQHKIGHLWLSLALALIVLTSAQAANAAGCFSRSPKRVDAFTGLVDRQSLTVAPAGPISNAGSLKVAVILSENSKTQIAWSQDVRKGMTGATRAMSSIFAGSQTVSESDRLCKLVYDPKFISDSVMLPLVRRFQSVEIVNDLAQFQQGDFDLLVLLDVSFGDIFAVGFIVGQKFETGTTLNAYFMNRADTLVGAIEVTLQERANPNKFLSDVATVRNEALLKYQAAVDGLLGPDPTLVSKPSTPSAADRLRAVDELLKQGLITPAEAAGKKASILKEL